MEKWNIFGKDYTEEEFWNEVEQGKIKVEVDEDPKALEKFIDEKLKELGEDDGELET